jgi:hypothetical protein
MEVRGGYYNYTSRCNCDRVMKSGTEYLEQKYKKFSRKICDPHGKKYCWASCSSLQ